jgi:hypothetical protein
VIIREASAWFSLIGLKDGAIYDAGGLYELIKLVP